MKAPARIAWVYLTFGLGWIFLTDLLVHGVLPPYEAVLQLVKGSLFVICSALLVYFLARRAARRLQEKEEARRREMRQTMAEVHHILRNYLNQMGLVLLEAENTPGFDKEVVALAHRLSDEAAAELNKLRPVE
ncbi:MAG: hypothetical protein SFU53_12675 [Terrimicrobiaceae bacterium]|nr:hypothetical protein [Terrimicrobiaceae bacterium]